MKALLAVITPIALFNSVLILPSGITGVVAALSTSRPFATSSAYIAGKFVPYFVLGLLIAVGLDTALDQLRTTTREAWQDPDNLLVVLQLLIGLVMIGASVLLRRADSSNPGAASETSFTPITAFGVAFGLTMMGLPGALLYFSAIDQILRAELAMMGVVKAILYYNAVFLSPLILVVLLRGLFGARSDAFFAAIARFFDRWSKPIMLFGLLCIGIVLALDAIGWFIEFPLLPSYLR